MNRNILTLILVSLPLSGFTQKKSAEAISVEFIGQTRPAIKESADASTGLNAVYVLYDTSDVALQLPYSPTTKVYVFPTSGAAYAEEIPARTAGDKLIVDHVEGNRGYVIDSGQATYYMWVVDYSSFPFDIQGVSVSGDSDCTTVILDIFGDAQALTYYTINGRKMELDRQMEIAYKTLEYDEDAASYMDKDVVEAFPSAGTNAHIDAPLCNTDFLLTGDRFLKAWGEPEVSCRSPYYTAIAVSASTTAEQESHTADNEQNGGNSGFGGSAPCNILFHAAVTDAAIFREWQLSKDAEFNDIFYRDNGLDFSYTFQEEGTTYVRFTASNDAATCDYYGPSYEVSIGESALICPNAFSPGSSEGINDEWKVSFKSIIDFECHIFNRWGVQVAHMSHPEEGWNGKYKGKLVPAGVYYYVIKARGADGKNYNLKGDINIINRKNRIGSTAPTQ